jgi:hypothetical protein
MLYLISNMKALLLLALLSLAMTLIPPPAYNVTASQELAKLAAIAFCSNTCVDTWSCGTGKGIPMEDPFYI